MYQIYQNLIRQKHPMTDKMGNIAKRMKEKMGRVALNYAEELAEEDKLSKEERSFELPDGSIVEVSKECRFDSTEILFDFNRLAKSEVSKYSGLGEMAIYSVEKCSKDIRNVYK